MSQGLNEVGRLSAVLIKHARDAFVSQHVIDAQWRRLNFSAPPHFHRATREYDAFLELLMHTGAEILELPADDRVTLDSLYTRDASIIARRGSIACSMGKAARQSESSVQEEYLSGRGLAIAGRIEVPGVLEGGDLVWLDDGLVAVGVGKRTNQAGVEQLRGLLGDTVRVIEVPLPDWESPQDVLHLMSLISPVDHDLAVVYSPLLAEAFREELCSRGCRLVEVPDEEFESMGTNVLALAPRVCVIVRGNPATRAALERAGATVYEYDGQEISLKGGGGPTCLTRPLRREVPSDS